MKYIKDLDDYLLNKTLKIKAKQKELEGLQEELGNKNKDIKQLETAYLKDFSETIADKITTLRAQADKLTAKNNNINKLINLMGSTTVFEYKSEDLQIEIETFVKALDIPSQIENVQAAREVYMKNLEIYLQKVQELANSRTDFESVESNISRNNKEAIVKAFNSTGKPYWDEGKNSINTTGTLQRTTVILNTVYAAFKRGI